MRKTPQFNDCFAQLISLPSVSSTDPQYDQSNCDVINTLASYFDALGFDCELMLVSDKPKKYNLIATRGEKQENSGLILSGHTDTVPYDLKGWNTDPFTLTVADDNYYGLGTADMKSFFPIILETLERLSDTTLNAPVTVVATADEESTMSGAKLIQQMNKVSGRYCVIGEPTGLKPIYTHKGILIETISIEGRSGHSSDPVLGNSALEGMYEVLTVLKQWRNELQEKYNNDDFKLPVPTMNFGSIHGGDNPNRICARCDLSLDLRMLPGMDLTDLSQQLRAKVRQTLVTSGLKVSFSETFNGVPAMQTAKNSEIISLTETLTQQRAESVAFGTEGPFYNDMGIETVILGPGDIDVAHQPNEYLPINRVEPMINILSKLLVHICNTE